MKYKFEKLSEERYYKKMLLYNFQVLRHDVDHLDTLTQKTVELKSLVLKWSGILEATATCTKSIEAV